MKYFRQKWPHCYQNGNYRLYSLVVVVVEVVVVIVVVSIHLSNWRIMLHQIEFVVIVIISVYDCYICCAN